MWRDSGTIIEFDDLGRVIRIPGVYPRSERITRYRPLILVLIGVALFVMLGLFSTL